MNKIEINKDNYKGYVELYKATSLYDEQQMNNFKEVCINCGKVFMLLMLVLFATPFLPISGLLFKSVITLECLIGFSSLLGISINGLIKDKKIKNKKIDNIKELYPYVDTKIKDEELENSLLRAGILSYDYPRSTRSMPKINDKEYEEYLKEYEDYLKCEEIKKDYLEETKYYGYTGDINLEYKELDFPKVKKIGALNRK